MRYVLYLIKTKIKAKEDLIHLYQDCSVAEN